jgi:DNA (cytosine-5)-methyltransferase 1
MKVVEMFTGIGSQAKALSRISNRRKVNINIAMTCEWNIHAILAYHFIHNDVDIIEEVNQKTKSDLLKELSQYTLSTDGKKPASNIYIGSLDITMLKRILSSIRVNNNYVDITKVKGQDIPDDTELLTYSFPCQDLSNVGSFHGYKHGIDRDKNTRSGLLWEVERILEERTQNGLSLPQFLLLENVTALEAKRHEGNFNQWKNKLKDLGYFNKVYRLNAQDFGIPQYRKRLIMLSVHVGNNIDLRTAIESYFRTHDLENPAYLTSLNIAKKNLNEYIKRDYSNQSYLDEALDAQPNATQSRRKIWDLNLKIIDENQKLAERVQTITTRQDRHPNSGNIFFSINNNRSKYRFLTGRECFLLMGFEEKDYEKLVNKRITNRNRNFFSRDAFYKLAGNSIVVNVLEAVFDQMIDVKEIIET